MPIVITLHICGAGLRLRQAVPSLEAAASVMFLASLYESLSGQAHRCFIVLLHSLEQKCGTGDAGL